MRRGILIVLLFRMDTTLRANTQPYTQELLCAHSYLEKQGQHGTQKHQQSPLIEEIFFLTFTTIILFYFLMLVDVFCCWICGNFYYIQELQIDDKFRQIYLLDPSQMKSSFLFVSYSMQPCQSVSQARVLQLIIIQKMESIQVHS